MLVAYASGRAEFKDVVGEALGRLKVPATALFLDPRPDGRPRARNALGVRWLLAEYEHLMANLKSGDSATANTTSWSRYLARRGKGFGFTEAPRGSLGHWYISRTARSRITKSWSLPPGTLPPRTAKDSTAPTKRPC